MTGARADFELHAWVADGWDAIFAALEAARTSIEVEQYIIGGDLIAQRLMHTLAVKARHGVRVRVLCDGFGSAALKKSPLPAQLRQAGAQLRFYAPLELKRLVRPPYRVHRDHRKAVVIDGRTAFLGGLCFAEYMRDWRDNTLQLRGPVVDDMAQAFGDVWAQSAAGASPAASLVNRAAGADGTYQYVVNRSEQPAWRELYVRLVERIEAAGTRVRLTTPYLSPNRRFLRALIGAARRGVRVELLLPERSDNRLADFVSHQLGRWLAGRGVAVYCFQNGVIHAKAAVVDDWALVGSLNLDFLSFYVNLENGIVSSDAALVARMDHQFDADRGMSRWLRRGGG